ncbi:MAG TPA: helix-turn-helix domain-containing protein [Kineosporiaceae bacterium]|nr:helix-turn-helix domain-containing protein [Kineosporiaceae bacterium]
MSQTDLPRADQPRADQADPADPAARKAGLSGRRGQAARNDSVILEAARSVFLEDAKAPIAAVAERAGVGISALYRRYASKEDLLRQVCHDGLRLFIAEAEAAASEPDDWSALVGFIRRLVAADVHSLTVHLAGTFTPTPEMRRDALRANALAAELMDRARAGGRLRPDVVSADLSLILEGCSAIRVPDAERTATLRQRYLAILLAGLAGDGDPPLPGPPPDGTESNWRWRR